MGPDGANESYINKSPILKVSTRSLCPTRALITARARFTGIGMTKDTIFALINKALPSDCLNRIYNVWRQFQRETFKILLHVFRVCCPCKG